MAADTPPPKGWKVFAGQLTRDETLWGYLHRKQFVRGSCYTRDCKRNYYLDFELLLRAGYVQVRMSEIQRLLKCNKPGGCSMTFVDEKTGSGLPLSVLASNSAGRIEMTCGGCKWSKTFTPLQAIAQLEAAKTGYASTLHTELAALSKACTHCGRSDWQIVVKWPTPANQKTYGERRLVEIEHQRQADLPLANDV
jgi:hypothetical protein